MPTASPASTLPTPPNPQPPLLPPRRLQAQDMASLRLQRPEEVLGLPSEGVAAVNACFPHWHSGYDREGRPVTYIEGARYDAAELFRLVPFEKAMRYHAWRTEAMLGAMYARAAGGGGGEAAGSVTSVVNLRGMGMGHVTKEFMRLIKGIAEMDQPHYPERLGKMYIVGVSRIFYVVWRIVRPWIDARTASKIVFLTAADIDALQKGIHPDQARSRTDYARTQIGRTPARRCLTLPERLGKMHPAHHCIARPTGARPPPRPDGLRSCSSRTAAARCRRGR